MILIPGDTNEGPTGSLLAFSFVALVTIVVAVLSFESCIDSDGLEVRQFCTDVRYTLEPPLAESDICVDGEGLLKFTAVNTGDDPIFGFNLNYNGISTNITKTTRSLGTNRYEFDVGTYNQESGTKFGVNPIYFIPDLNGTYMCTNQQIILKSVKACTRS